MGRVNGFEFKSKYTNPYEVCLAEDGTKIMVKDENDNLIPLMRCVRIILTPLKEQILLSGEQQMSQLPNAFSITTSNRTYNKSDF
jgi:hypothetical protein